MALLDEVRMDRTRLTVVKTTTPPEGREYWKSRTMQERLAALELTRQVMNGYDPESCLF